MTRGGISHWLPAHSRDVSPTDQPTECARCGIRFVYVEGFWHHDCGSVRPDRKPAAAPEAISRRRLASMLGVSENTIWRWEATGKSPVRPSKTRAGRVIYSARDASTLKAWMQEVA